MKRTIILFSSVLLLLLAACNGGTNSTQQKNAVDYSAVAIPQFDTDSAMAYTAAQLAFGPRTPGSKGQQQCAQYLAKMMRQWCDTVIVQEFNATLWNGQSAKGQNIIATIYPEGGEEANTPHILLAAHWDSRLWADHDPDETNHKKPIPGANDGASGVATLMEMARIMSTNRLNAAIDFVFFDLEDQGVPEWAEEADYRDNTWCLGSQYWSSTPHKPYYTARFGILFDMIGVSQPRFTKEMFSSQYASIILDKVWHTAEVLGYGNVFVNSKTDPIMDDHVYINRIANIPTIDIVQNSIDCSFYPYWHTMKDDLDAVDAESLRTVANVTLKTIYADFAK